MGAIAWIDLETTGVDEYDDPIIEVGLIVTTDKALTEMVRKSWTVIPRRPAHAIARIEANQPVLDMHKANGLYDELLAGEGVPHDLAVVEIMSTIAKCSPGNGRVPLGGSGVSHFDRRFIAAQMPALSDMLTYWAFDIGSVRRFGAKCGIAAPAEASDSSTKTHRALDDIAMHVEEARWWFRFLRSMKTEGVLRDMKREEQ